MTRHYNVININQSEKLKLFFHISNDWLYNGQALPDSCQLSKSYSREKPSYRSLILSSEARLSICHYHPENLGRWGIKVWTRCMMYDV